MAIGDTVQAGLGRMDFSAFQTAGAAQARANEAFGNALGQAATAYFAGKEKKERANEMTQYLMGQGASEEDAKAIAKNPFLQNEYQRKQAADQQMKIAQMQARTSIANSKRGAQLQDRAMTLEENAEKRKIAELEAIRQGKREMDNIFLMANAPSYTDDFGQFNQDTGNRAIDQSSPEAFLKTIREAGAMPQTEAGLGMLADELQRMRLASIPKPLSPSEKLAREKYDDEKAEIVKQTETAKIESTNNLTDFYNETKSLLDKINEKDVDVTGPIEGTSIYRFFSKIGDTEDEQVRRRLEMFTRKLTLDAAQNLKGALSDKDIRFLVEQAPDMDDNPSVWKQYMGDLKTRLERNAKQKGIEFDATKPPQQSSNTIDPSAPASQATLDELERKRQLRSKRAGL